MESVVSQECSPAIVNDLAIEFNQIKGGQPQAVLPQGGQGWFSSTKLKFFTLRFVQRRQE